MNVTLITFSICVLQIFHLPPSSGCFVCQQIELYNSMVEKEGSDGEKDAFKAYKAAREEHEHAAESDDDRDKVSSALIERVRTLSFIKS